MKVKNLHYLVTSNVTHEYALRLNSIKVIMFFKVVHSYKLIIDDEIWGIIKNKMKYMRVQ